MRGKRRVLGLDIRKKRGEGERKRKEKLEGKKGKEKKQNSKKKNHLCIGDFKFVQRF